MGKPDQRIHNDIGVVANLTLDLVSRLTESVVTLGSFLALLWALSGRLWVHSGCR